MIQIAWDETRCTSPQECRKCLSSCPQALLAIYPRDRRMPGKATENWAIAPLYLSLCTGCGICEEVCPEDALAVNIA